MTAPDRPLSATTSTSNASAARGKGGNSRIPNNLLALGSAAVLTIYSAGYLRTKSAADRFADEGDARRRPAPPTGSAPSSAGDASVSATASPTVSAQTVADASKGLSSKGLATNGIADSAAVGAVTSKAQTNAKGTSTSAASPSTNANVDQNHSGSSANQGGGASGDNSAPANAPSSGSAPSVVVDSVKSAPVQQAPAPAPAPVAPAVVEAPKLQLHDGTYTGYGTSRHGDIEATVVIEGGRITTAAISRCLTRYSCSWISHLQQQVVSRQSPEVDYVSGATQSTNAFYYAVVEALTKAK